ncbi:MAG: ATP-binding protein [bacterium]|nr:ATP-binding protein [bacterium]
MITNHDIVPTHLVVKAMRDNGYKNAAYAIAELMDNSIQAGATRVELLCAEKTELAKQRQRTRIHQIALLDNGCGMTPETLLMALQFGNGTRLAPEQQTGIGRFGMGLPNSSISQARRVEVWSWQNGVENAFYTYLDIDEIERSELRYVPIPEHKQIPEIWLREGKSFEKTGTLVVWSNLDRCQWRTAQTIIANSEMLIGRMYRFFLAEGKVTIRSHGFDINQKKLASDMSEERIALPNDPLYLMANTSCPEPFNNNPMFQQWGDVFEYKIHYNGDAHSVYLRFAYAKEEARQKDNAGNLLYGKHAANNVGVSIVRADRELDLDAGWIINYDPTERWWGAEIHFPPALDEIFGVTNNKQSARYFSEMAKMDIEVLIKDYGDSYVNMVEQMNADEDPRIPLIEIAKKIKQNISTMREHLKNQTVGLRTKKRYGNDDQSTAQKATEVTKKRIDDGYKGESDKQEETQTPEKRVEEIKLELVEQGKLESVAQELAAQTVGRGLKYQITQSYMSGSPAFFDVKSRGGAVMITLNINHPAYNHLIEVLEQDPSGINEDELRERLDKARQGLELLLMSWARYEDEEPMGNRRDRVQQARWDWGRYARQFLGDDDE